MHGNAWFTSKGVVRPGLMVMFGAIWENWGKGSPNKIRTGANLEQKRQKGEYGGGG